MNFLYLVSKETFVPFMDSKSLPDLHMDQMSLVEGLGDRMRAMARSCK